MFKRGFTCSKYIIIFCLFIYYFSSNLFSQNIVPNPGFEEYKKCPVNYTIKYREELIPGWIMPSLGTADYFNVCNTVIVGVPQNFMGNCFPKEGVAYAGLILLFEPPLDSTAKQENYREYLQVKLTQDLVKDKNYTVELYFSLATYSTYAVNRLGIYLSKEKIRERFSAGVINLVPQISIPHDTIFNEKDVWFCMKASYKAEGGERYLTIGNFYNDNNTSYVLGDLTGISSVKKAQVIKDRVAYYYFDSVMVKEE